LSIIDKLSNYSDNFFTFFIIKINLLLSYLQIMSALSEDEKIVLQPKPGRNSGPSLSVQSMKNGFRGNVK